MEKHLLKKTLIGLSFTFMLASVVTLYHESSIKILSKQETQQCQGTKNCAKIELLKGGEWFDGTDWYSATFNAKLSDYFGWGTIDLTATGKWSNHDGDLLDSEFLVTYEYSAEELVASISASYDYDDGYWSDVVTGSLKCRVYEEGGWAIDLTTEIKARDVWSNGGNTQWDSTFGASLTYEW